MQTKKITVSYDDLHTRRVENRLREQDALHRTRDYARMDEKSLPQATAPATPVLLRLWRNSVFAMALFGLTGGVLAWAFGLAFYAPHPREEAADMLRDQHRIAKLVEEGILTPEIGAQARARALEGRSNEYYTAQTDPNLTEAQRDQKIRELDSRNKLTAFIRNVLRYGVAGVMIAVFLAIALPVTERNVTGTIINGSVGAALGLLGGVVVSLLVGKLETWVHSLAARAAAPEESRQFFVQVAVWTALGLFLTIAPGLVMRNTKKFVIGLVGGLIGGLLGGVLYDTVLAATQNTDFGNLRPADLVGLAAIGLVGGLSTGLIESAAKAGWVRVVQGLIAGKQFILYRNPTYVGSGPDCQIYLFKDHKVGRRHAAFHIVAGRFEIEDLPLGESTIVNGRPLIGGRTRLRGGDRVQIGSTVLIFQEKAAAN
jgi:uncharacterized membrane protein YjfL (UPF0719 family)